MLDGLELALGIVAVVMAGVVLAAAPKQRVSLALATVLLVDGIGWFGLADGLAGFFQGPWLDVVRWTLAASPWLYGWLLVETVDLPSMRRLRRMGPAPWIAAALVVPLALWLWLDHAAWYQQISGYVGVVSGPHIAIGTWAFVAAWQQHRRDPSRQSAAYLSAFALRDVAVVVLFVAAIVAKQSAWLAGGFDWLLLGVKALLLVHLLFLIYAVLAGLVLGLDDQVRQTIQKALVLAVVSAVFLVMTEGVEMLVGVDSPALAIAAAGVITLGFQPLHAFAHRLADRLLPGHAGGDPIATYRRQVEIAAMDGVIGAKEREMLDRLREALGVPHLEAVRIERAVLRP